MSAIFSEVLTLEVLYMSDGPHKSMNLPSWWKKPAAAADNEAFVLKEVVDLMENALTKDMKKELPASFIKRVLVELEAGSSDLFGHLSSIEALRNEAVGAIPQLFLDSILVQSEHYDCPETTITKALMQTRSELAIRRALQVEEHYKVKTSAKRSINIRMRLTQACKMLDSSEISFDNERNRIQAKKVSPQRTGLDDGVRL